MRFLILLFLTVLLGTPARSEPPRVVTDIAPVHSLVAQVMAGVGAPELILPADASPHDFALRPSQASALTRADLVVWIGPALTPWLARSLAALTPQGERLTLLEHEHTVRLAFREGAAFETHDDHGHDHDHGHGDSEHEGHAGVDPHAWLDPQNGIIWLSLIADRLSALDPENAETYRENATKGRRALKLLVGEIHAQVTPLQGRPYVVLHDAYHYFEHRFDIEAAGAISAGDAATAGAARVQAIRNLIRDDGIGCVMSTPQIGRSVLANVIDGSGARLGVLDPMGIGHEAGPELYRAVLRDMAQALTGCLGPDGS